MKRKRVNLRNREREKLKVYVTMKRVQERNDKRDRERGREIKKRLKGGNGSDKEVAETWKEETGEKNR